MVPRFWQAQTDEVWWSEFSLSWRKHILSSHGNLAGALLNLVSSPRQKRLYQHSVNHSCNQVGVLPFQRPASIGPPEQNTVGMFSRIDAMSIPGVTLSQFEMQIMASAL